MGEDLHGATPSALDAGVTIVSHRTGADAAGILIAEVRLDPAPPQNPVTPPPGGPPIDVTSRTVFTPPPEDDSGEAPPLAPPVGPATTPPAQPSAQPSPFGEGDPLIGITLGSGRIEVELGMGAAYKGAAPGPRA
ncbi:MAG: hypothetical protein AB7N76_05080 [Planctomycetota bacterium]